MATQIDVDLFDGRGVALARTKEDVLLSVRDGSETTFRRAFVRGPRIPISTEFHDNLQDNHVVLASLKGHRDSGFMPVATRRDETTTVSLMLIPRAPEFEFAGFRSLAGQHAALGQLLANSFDTEAPRRLEELQGTRKRELACLLNIVEALAIVELPPQTGLRPTLAGYIERLDFAPALDWFRADRFFAWCHADIAPTMRGLPTLFQQAPRMLHPGATDSFKQFGFGEANVQVTLHEHDKGRIGENLIKVEFDIDYFRDSGAHALLEVFPNTLARFIFGRDSRESVTDPAVAYALRWMAGHQPGAVAQLRPFAPAFTIKPVPA